MIVATALRHHQKKHWTRVALVIMTICTSCTPYATTQIGPALASRPPDCEIAVLKPGETPARPYRDVGVVSLEHCQDYQIPPCREWLRRAACDLGGQVAYLDEYKRPRDPSDAVINPIAFRVLVAAYVADLYGNVENDPVYRSRSCKPPCKEGMQCTDGKCSAVKANCDSKTDRVEDAGVTKSPQKCLD